jgi:hypothetical protein
MIATSPRDFLDAFTALAASPRAAATARSAFLVTPSVFSVAAESASDNRYMDAALAIDPQRALAQRAALAQALRADCSVITFPGDASTPDAVFPNNVFATVPGRLIVGRMRHAVRQREAKRHDIRDFFRQVLGYAEVDLSDRTDLVAQLTGSLVIDRARGVGFCGLGERCNMAGARAMCEAFNLRLMFCFDLAGGEYHTNVILAVLAGRVAIIAPDGFRDRGARSHRTGLRRPRDPTHRRPEAGVRRQCHRSRYESGVDERGGCRLARRRSTQAAGGRGLRARRRRTGRNRKGRRQPALLRRRDFLKPAAVTLG